MTNKIIGQLNGYAAIFGPDKVNVAKKEMTITLVVGNLIKLL